VFIQAVCLRVKDDAFEFIFVVIVVKRGCFLLKNLMGSTKPCHFLSFGYAAALE